MDKKNTVNIVSRRIYCHVVGNKNDNIHFDLDKSYLCITISDRNIDLKTSLAGVATTLKYLQEKSLSDGNNPLKDLDFDEVKNAKESLEMSEHLLTHSSDSMQITSISEHVYSLIIDVDGERLSDLLLDVALELNIIAKKALDLAILPSEIANDNKPPPQK